MELTRRERYRRQTIDEIKQTAMTQVARGGEPAVSLNGIAKAMAMSPGALYRYFHNTDDLMPELAIDAYGDLARHLEEAAAATRAPDDAGAEVWAVAVAYRAWALRHPNTYRLIFESGSGSGLSVAADRVREAAQRSMNVFLTALDRAGAAPGGALPPELVEQVTRWGQRAHRPDLPTAVLHLALSFWTRLHGLVSLEIGHHLDATGVSAEALFQAELSRLTTALSS